MEPIRPERAGESIRVQSACPTVPRGARQRTGASARRAHRAVRCPVLVPPCRGCATTPSGRARQVPRSPRSAARKPPRRRRRRRPDFQRCATVSARTPRSPSPSPRNVERDCAWSRPGQLVAGVDHGEAAVPPPRGPARQPKSWRRVAERERAARKRRASPSAGPSRRDDATAARRAARTSCAVPATCRRRRAAMPALPAAGPPQPAARRFEVNIRPSAPGPARRAGTMRPPKRRTPPCGHRPGGRQEQIRPGCRSGSRRQQQRPADDDGAVEHLAAGKRPRPGAVPAIQPPGPASDDAAPRTRRGSEPTMYQMRSSARSGWHVQPAIGRREEDHEKERHGR